MSWLEVVWKYIGQHGIEPPTDLHAHVNGVDEFYIDAFARIRHTVEPLKTNYCFSVSPKNDINSYGNYTANNDYVIVFDKSLYAILVQVTHSLMLLGCITMEEEERNAIYEIIDHSFQKLKSRNNFTISIEIPN